MPSSLPSTLARSLRCQVAHALFGDAFAFVGPVARQAKALVGDASRQSPGWIAVRPATFAARVQVAQIGRLSGAFRSFLAAERERRSEGRAFRHR